MANDPMRSTQESVMPALKAVAMTTSSGGTTNTVSPTRGVIITPSDLEVALYFTDAPTTAITLTLKAGQVYPFSVTAVTFASGTCHAIY